MHNRACSQVAGDWRTGSGLGGRVRRTVLVGLAEPCRVHKPKGLGIVKQGIENGACVKYNDLVEVLMSRLESPHGLCKLLIIIRKGRCNSRDRLFALLEYERCTIGWRDCEKQERPGATLVQNFNLWSKHGKSTYGPVTQASKY